MAKKLGEVLRAARLTAGLSIRDLERLTTLPAGSISQIETGVRVDPGWSTVVRIARAIGVSLDEVAARCTGAVALLKTSGGDRKGVAGALAEIVRVRTDSERAVERLDRAITALGVPPRTAKARRRSGR